MTLNEAIKRNPYDPKRGNKSAYCRYLRYNVDGWYQLDSKEVLRRWQVKAESENMIPNKEEEDDCTDIHCEKCRNNYNCIEYLEEQERMNEEDDE